MRSKRGDHSVLKKNWRMLYFSKKLIDSKTSDSTMPIVVAMALGMVPARAGFALCLALALVTFLVLLPLDYAWFRLLHQL